MIETERTLVIGVGTGSIVTTLTQSAVDLLNGLPGASSGSLIADHRALLTTIVVGRAASGGLRGTTLNVDIEDILDVIIHPGRSSPR